MHAVVFIPDFHLQAMLRFAPELRARPVALMDDGEPKAAVMQMTAAARASGVSEGQTSTQAMARCREVVIRARVRGQEEAASEILLQCAYCFSPRIEATAAGVCTMDLRGLPVTRALAEGDAPGAEEWGGKILRALERTGLAARMGVAETPSLAWQAAKAAQVARPFLCVTDAGAFVAAMPIASLEPTVQLASLLERWGVRNVGTFLALGKEKIAERLGGEGLEMCDRILTGESRPLNLVAPSETFEEFMEFEQPVETLEPLLFVLRRFIEQLAQRLSAVYVVTQELRLRLGLTSGNFYERVFVIPAPTGDVATLFRMMQTHLENVRTEAPIHSLRLGAKPGRAGNYQFGLFEMALRDPNQFHETLGRIDGLVGANRLGAPRLRPTHRPDAFVMDVEGITRDAFGELELDDEVVAPEPPEQTCGLALRRCRPPLPAMVELREGKPAALRSALVSGVIVATLGPWRLSGDWWDNGRWAREEWEAQTGAGELCRLLRVEGQWFLDGLFD